MNVSGRFKCLRCSIITCWSFVSSVRLLRPHARRFSPCPHSSCPLPLLLQHRLLTTLGEDMDVTQTRLKAAQKRMSELIRKSGGMTQLCVVVVLSVILLVLVGVAFM